jgi:hypothetical protein
MVRTWTRIYQVGHVCSKGNYSTLAAWQVAASDVPCVVHKGASVGHVAELSDGYSPAGGDMYLCRIWKCYVHRRMWSLWKRAN